MVADHVDGNPRTARVIGIFKPNSPVVKTVTVHYLETYMATGKWELPLACAALQADQ